MSTGALTGIVDGAITGWIAAGAGSAAILEVVTPGEAPFEALAAGPQDAGRIAFTVPIPERFHDGRVRFFEVRLQGAEEPLSGGPAIFDGGLFEAPLSATTPRSPVEGEVRPLSTWGVEGWARCAQRPGEPVQVQVWLGDEMVATAAADQPSPSWRVAGGDDRPCGFVIDLRSMLRRGPHRITVLGEGSPEPLAGGRLTVGPFPADAEVPCPGYLDDEAARAALESAPFEHLRHDAARMSTARIIPRLINRLRRERLAAPQDEDRAVLFLIGDVPPEAPARQLWALQSRGGGAAHQLGKDVQAAREAAAGAGWVFFARASDLLHPSAVHIAFAEPGCDALIWPRYCADAPKAGSGGVLLRRPAFDAATWRHGAVTDTTLAVRGEVIARAPDAVLRSAAKGRLHPLLFWLAGQDLKWRTHPEALTASVGPEPAAGRGQVEKDVDLCQQMLIEDGERFMLVATAEEHPFPFVLLPARRASRTSVLLSFRDRAEITLRCIASIARQTLTGELELILVDNQSAPAEAAKVLAGARTLLGERRVTALAYDRPFNHSAQTNLGARAARGEALVICNNDVVLDDPSTLEQLSAWALQDGIGAVGCRLENPDRPAGSYGHLFTPLDDDPFRPPLQESADETYARLVHACPGVTLALAAVARDTYLAAGGLDEARFPIGYNDMDLMLRFARAGLRCLYLGHVAATHFRGSSRTGDNENLQALAIRQTYGAELAGRWTQLSRERLEAPVRSAPAEAPAAAPGTGQDEEALAAVIAARREVEASRLQLVEKIRSAARSAQELAESLAAAEAAALGG